MSVIVNHYGNDIVNLAINFLIIVVLKLRGDKIFFLG